MAYKQSPFPMVEGTSPLKQKTWLLKQAVKYGARGAKYVKSLFSKTKKYKPANLKVGNPYTAGQGKTMGQFTKEITGNPRIREGYNELMIKSGAAHFRNLPK